jgi:hypothetical protein
MRVLARVANDVKMVVRAGRPEHLAGVFLTPEEPV